jgi:hypothetical protein
VFAALLIHAFSMLPPPLPATSPRRARSALGWSLLWPGLGQLHNRQLLLGTLAFAGNTALYLAAVPWGRIARVYSMTQTQTGEIVEGRADPGRAISKIIETAFAPLPASTTTLLTLALVAALALHAFLTWQAWHYAQKQARPPALPV